ncbi:hypothetical protein IV102_01885 [bacterium]|nr:hypothetical protein [bacterium]
MINTIAPRAFTYSAPMKAQPGNIPASPVPANPVDGIDLSQVDTAQKAAQLPILDPGFQLGLAGAIAGLVLSSMGGSGSAEVSLDYSSQSGANESKLHYGFSADNLDQAIAVSGTYNGQPVGGGLVVDPATQGLNWKAELGANLEDYTFALDGPTQTSEIELLLRGKLGSVDADLKFSVLGDVSNPSPDTIEGYKVSGTLGGRAYEAVTRYALNPDLGNMPQPPVGQTLNIATVTTTGSLGDLEINRQYEITGQLNSQDSLTATASGGGVNAGIDTQSKTVLNFHR